MPRSNIITVWTSALVVGAACTLTGCVGSQKELLPTEHDTTMSSVWHHMTGGSASSDPPVQPSRLQNARQRLRRPLQVKHAARNSRVTLRTAAVAAPLRRPAVDQHFRRLPNPTLQLYVYAHMDGHGEHVPVPGYTTIFPLYQRPHYARRDGAEVSPRRPASKATAVATRGRQPAVRVVDAWSRTIRGR